MDNNAKAISASQSEKARNGIRKTKVLEEAFSELQEQGLIQSFKVAPHYPYVFAPGLSDKASSSSKLAGYAPFVIERPNGRFILVYSSTSFRLDRTYANQEDAKRIREHSELTGKVDCAVFILDDSPGNTTSTKNVPAMRKLQARVSERRIHSYVDFFMLLSEFPTFLKGLP